MRARLIAGLRRWLTALVWAYYTFLFGWVAAYFLTGDRYVVVALVNAMAVYLFLPLPLVLPIALVIRRRDVWLGMVAGVAVFLWLWGGLFLPRPEGADASGPTLTLFTYNVLGLHDDTAPVLNVIRAENADVVLLQEVNTRLAAAVRAELAEAYPHQMLDPVDGVSGIGTISKYPIRPTGQQ